MQLNFALSPSHLSDGFYGCIECHNDYGIRLNPSSRLIKLLRPRPRAWLAKSRICASLIRFVNERRMVSIRLNYFSRFLRTQQPTSSKLATTVSDILLKSRSPFPGSAIQPIRQSRGSRNAFPKLSMVASLNPMISPN